MSASNDNNTTGIALTLSDSERLFFADISTVLQEGRTKAYAAVNFAMVETYWKMGRMIVEQEQQGNAHAKYGEYLLVNLSRHLNQIFGKGFSYANLRNFRQFYLTFPDKEICYTLCSKLSWSHIRLIMRIESEILPNTKTIKIQFAYLHLQEGTFRAYNHGVMARLN